jgi:hypothetical protein
MLLLSALALLELVLSVFLFSTFGLFDLVWAGFLLSTFGLFDLVWAGFLLSTFGLLELFFPLKNFILSFKFLNTTLSSSLKFYNFEFFISTYIKKK